MSNPYEAAATDLAAIREICERYGFCLVKGALSPEKLERLLAGMKAASGAYRGQPMPDLLGLPHIRHIYFDPDLLGIARALLGPHLVYDGEATFNYEEAIGGHTLNPFALLHCDAIGMPHNLRAIWRSPTDEIYRAYRFGIYFQDYRRASGALKVIAGSHRGDPDLYMGEKLISGAQTSHMLGTRKFKYTETRLPLHNVPSQPGDVVIWNLRTFHSAGAKCFVDDPSFAVHPDFEARYAAKPGVFAPPPGPRNAAFFDYAAPAPEIDLYIKYRARPTAESLRTALARRSDDEDSLALAAAHDIDVRNDALIAALVLAAAMGQAGETSAAGLRLYRLLKRHKEYSAHFRLFDQDRFRRAPTPDQAIDGAVSDILETLRSEGVLFAKPGA